MSELKALTVPQWGLTMEEGVLVEWRKDVGEAIAKGDEVCDIETTKIANAVEATFEGVLVARIAEPGQTLPVGALLGVVTADGAPGEDEIGAFVSEFQSRFETEQETKSVDAEPLSAEAGGRTLSYRRSGPEDAAPVILLHGFGGDKDNWLFNISDLAAAYSVYALDLPGHGASSKDVGDGSVAALAEALLAFMESLKIGAAHLVGHSLGGAVALAVCAADASKVKSLSLVAPAGLSKKINGPAIEAFVHADRRKAMKAALGALFGDEALVTRDMTENSLRYKRLDGVPEALSAIAGAAFAKGEQQAVFADQVGGLGVPILAIWGEDDAILSPDDASVLEGFATVVKLPGVAHMPHMQAASEVNAALKTHLAGA